MATPKVELISRKLIEPSFSTPPPLTSYKLGLSDQLMSSVYIPIAFFYPNTSASGSPNDDVDDISIDLLENSLSRVLASYYPLAGREVDNLNIDCNSEMKATLIEANVDCKMSQISENPNINDQDVVFPSGLPWKSKDDESLVVAQLTHFNCGGKSLSLCMSHKVADGLTLCNFAGDWANAIKQQGDQDKSASPLLNSASVLPPIEDPSFKAEFGSFSSDKNCVTKRFIFDSSKLSELKAKVSAETGIENPSRVEVVTALIHNCAHHAAASVLDQNSSKPSIFIQVVNMRPLINPPIPSNSVGNFTNFFGVPFFDTKDLTFSGLVSELNKAKVQFYDKFKGVTAEELRQEIMNSIEQMKMMSSGESSLDQYICTSMCRYTFYDNDFGWGKPEKVIFGASGVKNFIILIDDPNGEGIEAFVPLDEKVMNVFETDPELLQFASF
nr:BAHD acyltransferase [Echium plantagineum]